MGSRDNLNQDIYLKFDVGYLFIIFIQFTVIIVNMKLWYVVHTHSCLYYRVQLINILLFNHLDRGNVGAKKPYTKGDCAESKSNYSH